MKTFALIFTFAAALALRAAAQIEVAVTTEQNEFLPGEAVPIAVQITNRSGQRMHFGDAPSWLSFSVESADGSLVVKNGDVPVVGPFDLESSQMGIKHVDIEPYFNINPPGRYKIIATVNVKDWGIQVASKPKSIDVVPAVGLWSQNFGMPSTGGLPEVRKYSLKEANFLRRQLRLYAQVSDATDEHIFKVIALGPMVSFGRPIAQVDRSSCLNVLWQIGGQTFSYCVVNPSGDVVKREIYDIYSVRPHLAVNTNGDVVVVGGTLRTNPNDLPAVKSPEPAQTAPTNSNSSATMK